MRIFFISVHLSHVLVPIISQSPWGFDKCLWGEWWSFVSLGVTGQKTTVARILTSMEVISWLRSLQHAIHITIATIYKNTCGSHLFGWCHGGASKQKADKKEVGKWNMNWTRPNWGSVCWVTKRWIKDTKPTQTEQWLVNNTCDHVCYW